MLPKIIKTAVEAEFISVRFREPGQFTTIRTPTWAKTVAQSVSKGSKVRMGQTPAGNWLIQSVLITDKWHNKREARKLARRIADKVES